MDIVDPWVIWLAAALILFALDILVAGGASGFLLLFSLMTLAGAIAAMLGLSLNVQIAFAVVSGLVFLPVVLYIMRRITRGQRAQNNDGRLASEVFTLEQDGSRLSVKALGDTYPVKAEVGHDPSDLAVGTKVRILRFEGITAIVRPDTAEPDTTDSTSHH